MLNIMLISSLYYTAPACQQRVACYIMCLVTTKFDEVPTYKQYSVTVHIVVILAFDSDGFGLGLCSSAFTVPVLGPERNRIAGVVNSGL